MEQLELPFNIKQVLVGLRPYQVEALDKIVDKTGVPRSSLIRDAVDEWLKRSIV